MSRSNIVGISLGSAIAAAIVLIACGNNRPPTESPEIAPDTPATTPPDPAPSDPVPANPADADDAGAQTHTMPDGTVMPGSEHGESGSEHEH